MVEVVRVLELPIVEVQEGVFIVLLQVEIKDIDRLITHGTDS